MTDDFSIHDSGERQEFESGMVRDVTEGKIDYTLIYDGPMIDRWATHLTMGAVVKGYGKRNWMQANGPEEQERFRESAARHFRQWIRGDRDEDHAAAVFFNINGFEYVANMLPRIDVLSTAQWCNLCGYTVLRDGTCGC